MNNFIIKDEIPEEQIAWSTRFGSRVYGNHREDSDHDHFCLVKFNTGDVRLQYKKDNVDLIYVGPDAFISGLEKGSDQIFFEVMHNKILKAAGYNVMNYYTSKNARCHLGLAKRDLITDLVGRLFHINRCIYIADKIIKKELIDFSTLHNIPIQTDKDMLLTMINVLRKSLKW